MVFFRGSVSGGEFASDYQQSPLSFKGVNDHVLICGSSGSGKSLFAHKLFPDPASLILFKPDPEFSDVPFLSSVKMADFFRFGAQDISDSYLYSLGMDMTGIMAASLVPVLMGALEQSANFEQFFKYLESLTFDHLVSTVASVIRSHFLILSTLYIQKNKRGRPPVSPIQSYGKINLKVNLAGLGTFRSEFAAELLLRKYYSSIGKDLGTLFIDEFHHVSRERSIVDTLLREFRSSGQLVGITQNLSDVAPSMLSNFGNILVGRSINPDDMKILASLSYNKYGSPILPDLVSSLPKYVFLNLTEFLANTSEYPYYRWYD